MPFPTRVIPHRTDVKEVLVNNQVKNILEKTAVSGMVGLLQQLNILSKHASEVFTELLDDTLKQNVRIQKVKGRIRDINNKISPIEDMYLTKPPSFFYDNPYTEQQWRREDHMRGFLFSRDEAPQSVNRRRVVCDIPPDLSALDKFTTDGRPCGSKYSDLDFFMNEWIEEQQVKMEEERKKRKARKEQRRKNRKVKRKKKQKIMKVRKKKYNKFGEEFKDEEQKEDEYVETKDYDIDSRDLMTQKNISGSGKPSRKNTKQTKSNRSTLGQQPQQQRRQQQPQQQRRQQQPQQQQRRQPSQQRQMQQRPQQRQPQPQSIPKPKPRPSPSPQQMGGPRKQPNPYVPPPNPMQQQNPNIPPPNPMQNPNIPPPNPMRTTYVTESDDEGEGEGAPPQPPPNPNQMMNNNIPPPNPMKSNHQSQPSYMSPPPNPNQNSNQNIQSLGPMTPQMRIMLSMQKAQEQQEQEQQRLQQQQQQQLYEKEKQKANSMIPKKSVNLLAGIKSGVKLKKIDPDKIKREKPKDNRSLLMQSLQKGAKLKKVKKEDINKKPVEKPQKGGIFEILKRRQLIADSDSESDSGSDWGSESE